jgi:hypothetical protein
MIKPDQTVNMTLRMTKKAKAVEEIAIVEECKLAVSDLFWQDVDTGEFNIKPDITEYIEYATGPGG